MARKTADLGKKVMQGARHNVDIRHEVCVCEKVMYPFHSEILQVPIPALDWLRAAEDDGESRID